MLRPTATLRNYRQSPRKVRVVADLVRGKDVETALHSLQVLPKRATLPLITLIKSAVANIKQKGGETDGLKVTEIRVDKGFVLMRRRPMSRGRAFPIKKRTSHVSVTLSKPEPKK